MTSFEPGSSSSDDSETLELLSPEESLDDDEVGIEADEGYSPAERPWGLSAWGTTAREAASYENLGHRLAREEPEQRETVYGDGIGDTSDTDGELIDDQVGEVRAGRLVLGDIDASDPGSDYWAYDVGIDGAGASAEEAAVHVVAVDPVVAVGPIDDDLNAADDAPSGRRTVAAGHGDLIGVNSAENNIDHSTDSLDDLAAFLMHRAYEPDVSAAERLQSFAVVDAYQEGDDPATVESAMRTMALQFRDHPDYRPEWRPRPGSST